MPSPWDVGIRSSIHGAFPKFALNVPPTEEDKDDVRKMLNEVKHLFFDRRYRQCASKCGELLEKHCQDHHPLIRTYLCFYAALSYDTLARSMHNMSVARVPSLQQAEDFYNKALATLPEGLPLQQGDKQPQSPSKQPPVEHDHEPQQKPATGKPSLPSMWDLNSTFEGFDTSSTPSRRHSFSSSKPSHTRTDSVLSETSWNVTVDTSPQDPFVDNVPTSNNDANLLYAEHPSIKRPSPLHIRKAKSTEHLSSNIHSESPTRAPHSAGITTNGTNFPPATPPTFKFPNFDNNDTSTAATPVNRLLFARDSPEASLPVPSLNARIQRYNADLSEFRGMLVAHLLNVQTVKSTSTSRASSRSVSAESSAPLSPISPTDSSSSSSGWSEATATNAPNAAEESRRRSAIMFSADTGNSGRSMTEHEKLARINSGRARAWKRERFEPQRYRDLARSALAELGA